LTAFAFGAKAVAVLCVWCFASAACAALCATEPSYFRDANVNELEKVTDPLTRLALLATLSPKESV
jgi:hypothetical protein